MEWLMALGIVLGFMLLLVWTRGRWGEPRLNVRGTAALWLAAVILAVIVLRLVLE